MRQHVLAMTGAAMLAALLTSAAAEAAPRCRNTGSFEVWLAGFKQEAAAQGISRQAIAAALLQRRLQLELAVEVVLQHALAAGGDENELIDPGGARLVDHVLDERPVDQGEHFLGHRLGGGQEPGAETGDGQDGFADGFHGRADTLET